MEQDDSLDTINEYFKHLGRMTRDVNREETARLWALAKKGDKEAKHRILESNLRLVIPTAKRFWRPGMELMDLVEEGNLGLLHAIEKFEPSKGYRFSTYAIYWIEQYIRKYIEEQSGFIRIPSHAWGNLKKWFRAWNELKEANGREPTLQEMAKELDLTARQVTSIMDTINAAKGIDSLATIVYDEEDMTLEDTLSDDGKGNPHEVFSQKEDNSRIKQSMADLSDRDRQIIIMRYGLDDNEPKTLGEVSDALGLSRERVRQIENRAIATLRREALRAGILEHSEVDFRTRRLHSAMRPRVKTDILGKEHLPGPWGRLLRKAKKAAQEKSSAKKIGRKPTKKSVKKIAKSKVTVKKTAKKVVKKAVHKTSRRSARRKSKK